MVFSFKKLKTRIKTLLTILSLINRISVFYSREIMHKKLFFKFFDYSYKEV